MCRLNSKLLPNCFTKQTDAARFYIIAGIMVKPVAYARIPKINDTYRFWLRTLAKIPQNKPAFVQLSKKDTDEVFERVAQEQYVKNPGTLERLLNEVSHLKDEIWSSAGSYIMPQARSYQGGQDYERIKAAVISSAKIPITQTSPTAALKLPTVPRTHMNSRDDPWAFQTYDDFARKAEKLNSGVEFQRDLMDEAFRLAVVKATTKRMTGAGLSKTNVSKMLSRVSSAIACSRPVH